MVFCFGKNCLAEPVLKINNLQFDGGAGKADEDFIEISNTSTDTINLKGYRLVKRATTAIKDTSIKSWTSDEFILPGGKYVWANSKNGFALAIGANTGTTETISSTNGIALRFGKMDEGTIIDSVNWKKDEVPPSEDTTKEDEKKSYIGKIKINEVYPSPNTKLEEKEFIEIKNISTEKINLKSWSASDSIHEGKTTIDTDSFLEPNGLYAFEGNFYLNTPSDTAKVFDENKVEVDSLLYDKAKSVYAYAFDGSAWQWTSKVTKGAQNEFDKLISGKVQKDDKVYVNVYANFEANVDKKAKRFTWNFGDGHKSYLKKTRHKYEETGTYAASLKITGDGKENLITFEVEVEKFGKAKVRITGLSANPKGLDSEKEYVLIQNKTKKKINLKNWSVATGWKTLSNHPIREDFILKSGESKKLTRDLCAFTLGNKQAKIELRYPDGKVADKIKYNRKDDSISEDELYQKTTAGWNWTTPEKEPAPANEEPESPAEPLAETPIEEKPEETNADINLSLLGKSTEDPAWREKQRAQVVLLFAKSNINPEKFLAKNQGQVLGISTENHFQITHTQEETWKSVFSVDFVWKKINTRLNQLILLL